MSRAGTIEKAQRTGRRAATHPAMQLLARIGYAARGVVYLIIGGLAAKVAVGDGGRTTDRNGALRAIYTQPFGKVLLTIVTIGLIGYAVWSFIQAVFDTDHQGTDASGLLTRAGYAAIGVSYGALAVVAAQLVLGTGNGGASSDTTAHDWTARFLALPFGPFLVVVGGIIVIGLAGYQIYRAYTAQFEQSLSLGELGSRARQSVIALGRAGYASLGAVFGVVGVFLIIAALRDSPGTSKGLGGALRELAQQPYGHLILGVVAVGLIAYGLYSFAEARYRRLGSA